MEPPQYGFRPLAMALEMMKYALPLLDRAGETVAAIHLQHAISVAEKERVPRKGDDPAAGA